MVKMRKSRFLTAALMPATLALAALAADAGLRAPVRVAPPPPPAAMGEPVADSPLHYGAAAGKAAVDTVTLMGPGGAFPYRGDFETADALPAGDGGLTDGWTSIDETAAVNHWHVADYDSPGTGQGAWCGQLSFAACDAGDPVGGYGNNWSDVLEFRRTVPGAVTVRVQARLRHDTEPGYDYVALLRRTAAEPAFEPIWTGQGQAWDGAGEVTVDHQFTYQAAELLGGSEIAVAFVVDSDGAFSDEDCNWPTAGAAIVDDLVVTLAGAVAGTFTEDFEDGSLGPDWTANLGPGVGDFARVWNGLCDSDPCVDNPSNQVAFIDLYPDLWILPPPPAGCGMVNNTGGDLGPAYHLNNAVLSPVMDLPAGGPHGLTLDFDVYEHELLVANDTPGIFYTWSVRSAATGQDIGQAAWRSRNFLYYGGPSYKRRHNEVGDLLAPDAHQVQVRLAAVELGWMFGYGNGTNGTPAPYFDNVRVLAYPAAGPRLLLDERTLANDAFPASRSLDLANLGANSVRFDMAGNISARAHLRNDPGDSICIDATPRSGGTLATPVLHWTFARKNPLFTDAVRSELAPGQVSGSTLGRVTRTATGAVVANRFNFDLPDTGMLFPGDILHYYFTATDVVNGDMRTARAPAEAGGYGDPTPGAWPDLCTVRCLPSVTTAGGGQPPVLLWNDQGLGDGADAWYEALACGLIGREFDVFATHAPKLGLGNGLGGRAALPQVAGYDVIVYTAGTLGAPTLSNGDYAADPGNDLALVDSWLDLGYRGLFLAGDDLAGSLYFSGLAGRAFLADRLGVEYRDPDVRDDIAGQLTPLVAAASGPVLPDLARWRAVGGCPDLNDFDNIAPLGTAEELAGFAAPDGNSLPYGCAALIRNVTGTSTVLTMNHDLQFVGSGDASSAASTRARLLVDVVQSLWAGIGWCGPSGAELPGGPATARLAVEARPNPFNPAVTLRYSLPRPGHVVMKVFDARGALVRTLLDGSVAAASGVVAWDGADDRGGQVSSGLYFVETRADGQADVRKVTMLK